MPNKRKPSKPSSKQISPKATSKPLSKDISSAPPPSTSTGPAQPAKISSIITSPTSEPIGSSRSPVQPSKKPMANLTPGVAQLSISDLAGPITIYQREWWSI